MNHGLHIAKHLVDSTPVTPAQRQLVRTRLADEVGRMDKQAPFTMALCYPSPYGAGMSSLGFQRIYRSVMETPGMACERVFLDDEAAKDIHAQGIPLSYEGLRPLSDFPIVSFSVAYEGEIVGMLKMLDMAGIPLLAEQRDGRHPFVLLGGPLTFSNPLPIAAFADAMIIGEAEELTPQVLELVRTIPKRADLLDVLSKIDHVHVPLVHGENLPLTAKVPNEMLPAWAPIRTPHAVLSDMFLIETERGCSRTCTYCVMRRSTNGGMRMVQMDKLLSLVPADAKRVGLVGAAVSDHPKIVDIVNTLVDQGREVGLSSLRPDRLSDAFVGALKRGGYRTLTTAMDGPSDRLRGMLERKAKEQHLLNSAERARAHGMDRLKLYLMIGLPTETNDDIDECVKFTREISKIVPLSLGIAPFCAKRNTPMDGMGFAGIKTVNDRLDRLKRGVQGKVDVRSTSSKWAWVEYILAQGGMEEGKALIDVMRAGGKFADHKRALSPFEAKRAAGDKRRHLAIANV